MLKTTNQDKTFMRATPKGSRLRKQATRDNASVATPPKSHALTAGDRRTVLSLLKSGTQPRINRALRLLDSHEAQPTDYENVFSEPVVRAIVRNLNAKTILATARQLLPHRDACGRLLAAAADRFCKVTESERLQFLQDLFHQPFCFVACHADPAQHRLNLDMSDGTVLWDVLHRELFAAQRVKIQFRESQEEGLSTCIVHSLNGIHLAGYYRDRGEGRPNDTPDHVLQASDLDCYFPRPDGWFEVAWAVSFENMIGRAFQRTTEIWDAHDWCWGGGEHLLVAMLWTCFSKQCLRPKDAARLDKWQGTQSTPLRKRKVLFRWTDRGAQALASYATSLLRHRKFIKPGIGSVFTEWPDSPYLPWQWSESSWENEFEARVRTAKKKYASYASLPDDIKLLACHAARAARDAANRVRPLSEGVQVIERLANHTLICLALHPATPSEWVQSLAADAYGPVASAATAGRSAKSAQRSPTDQMRDCVDFVVRGTGGPTRTTKASTAALAIAQRLDSFWKRWKRNDSLNDIDAVNTDDPHANETRMRAVAMGVALARGWIVPTRDGLALMRESLAALDATPRAKSRGAEDDDY